MDEDSNFEAFFCRLSIVYSSFWIEHFLFGACRTINIIEQNKHEVIDNVE